MPKVVKFLRSHSQEFSGFSKLSSAERQCIHGHDPIGPAKFGKSRTGLDQGREIEELGTGPDLDQQNFQNFGPIVLGYLRSSRPELGMQSKSLIKTSHSIRIKNSDRNLGLINGTLFGYLWTMVRRALAK